MVVPVRVEGIRIDIVIARLPYEHEAIARSIRIPVLGHPVQLCTAEDLIIQKCISEGERDWMDIEGVVQSLGQSLDWDLILTTCAALSSFIGDSAIISRLRQLAHA